MKINVGGIDKNLRIAAGLAVIAWGVIANNWLGAIGLVPLITGFVNFCPVYALLGFKTSKT
jgi:hypothetical protein